MNGSRFLEGLSGRERLLLFLFVLILSGLPIAFTAGGTTLTIIISVLITLLLVFTRPIWLPPGYGTTRVRLASLTVVSAVALSMFGWRPLLEVVVLELTKDLPQEGVARWINAIPYPERLTAALVLMFVLVGVFIVNYLARDKSRMGIHPIPLDEEFPEKTYRARLRQFGDVLDSHLRTLNLETRWSDANFTPLQAEVEIVSGQRRRRKVMDLISAIRSERKNRIFLVLGDPGSGKSVALRKLASEFLGEVERTGRLPVYVNLKQWQPPRPWTEEDPPTVEQLYDFILGSLKARSDVFGEEFLTKYFKDMLDNGRFFLMLDSFDEIPAVLDVTESSWLIDRLSAVISTFLAGAEQTRGIVASRFYRRPNLAVSDLVTLDVRPFTELRIAETLSHSMSFNPETVKELFSDHAHLVPAARNPFTADLLRTHLDKTQGKFPSSQLELYRTHIQNRLEASGERLANYDLTIEEVVDGAIDIAWFMFRHESLGLEAPVGELKEGLERRKIPEILAVLQFARLARGGSAGGDSFGFVHRRFAEYFVAQRFVDNPALVNLDSIPTDSRWRDALVLYCEVADRDRAEEMAGFCWSEASYLGTPDCSTSDPRYLRAVHSLRFLTDAFRTRTQDLHDCQGKLASLLSGQLDGKINLLNAKIALEATGLLAHDDVESLIGKALKIGNPLISETAVRACRHLAKLNAELQEQLRRHVDSIELPAFLRRERELLFSFDLSDSLGELRGYCRFRALDARILLIGLLGLAAFAPVLLVALGMLVVAKGVLTGRPFSRLGMTRVSGPLAMGPILISEMFDPGSAFLVAKFTFVSGFVSVPDLLVLICGILALCLPPWYMFHGRGLAYVRRHLRGIAITLLIGLIVIGGFAGVAAIVHYVGLWLGTEDALVIVLFVCAGLAAVAFAVDIGSGIVKRIGDWQAQRILRAGRDRERAVIQEHFNSMRTPGGRLAYVQYLRDAGIKATGTWIGGLPNVRNDLASSMLAELEERWLGLDR